MTEFAYTYTYLAANPLDRGVMERVTRQVAYTRFRQDFPNQDIQHTSTQLLLEPDFTDRALDRLVVMVKFTFEGE